MKEISFDIINKQEIELIVISDTHIGSKQCNIELLKETVDYIKNNEDCYCILNGDILDNLVANSKVGDPYENAMTPSVALNMACEIFDPIKEKILCSLGGNHDYDRSKKLTDITPAMALAVYLGLEKKFSADSVILYLNFKYEYNRTTTFSIFVNHGRNGGGRNSGSKANALESMSLIVPSCNIYIHSHTHYPMTFKDEFFQVDPRRRRGIWCERLYVNTNAFLNYFNGYGEAKLYRPSSQSIPKIKLNVTRIQKHKTDRLIKSISCEI